MTTHSEFPWEYDISYNSNNSFDIHAFGDVICQVARWNGDNDRGLMAEAKANAILIAAAPTLLYALEAIVDVMRCSCDPKPEKCGHYIDALQLGYVAIAKATPKGGA